MLTLGRASVQLKKNVSILSEGHGVVHYDSIDFTFEGKTQTEFIEWTEKSIDDKIAWYLQRHLMSKNLNPSGVLSIQVVLEATTAIQLSNLGNLYLSSFVMETL